ncbi:uncharacterized protein F5891DRAFT_974376 [Suillus fuscotomentosus]|uniref:Uncharacterized protein n=1 Tax=Suillus fuscotomentosus TaxID=1912939 RepID=A0AAD4EK85_9AGAM|nr:uncharacterized protein F5891DRAFT_974376 [Suillus fuscotomentosus]KAG1907717.1 hypothetical protein F5891DRAFT_974376 [Suillus fuscotomentosus]
MFVGYLGVTGPNAGCQSRGLDAQAPSHLVLDHEVSIAVSCSNYGDWHRNSNLNEWIYPLLSSPRRVIYRPFGNRIVLLTPQLPRVLPMSLRNIAISDLASARAVNKWTIDGTFTIARFLVQRKIVYIVPSQLSKCQFAPRKCL